VPVQWRFVDPQCASEKRQEIAAEIARRQAEIDEHQAKVQNIANKVASKQKDVEEKQQKITGQLAKVVREEAEMSREQEAIAKAQAKVAQEAAEISREQPCFLACIGFLRVKRHARKTAVTTFGRAMLMEQGG